MGLVQACHAGLLLGHDAQGRQQPQHQQAAGQQPQQRIGQPGRFALLRVGGGREIAGSGVMGGRSHPLSRSGQGLGPVCTDSKSGWGALIRLGPGWPARFPGRSGNSRGPPPRDSEVRRQARVRLLPLQIRRWAQAPQRPSRGRCRCLRPAIGDRTIAPNGEKGRSLTLPQP